MALIGSMARSSVRFPLLVFEPKRVDGVVVVLRGGDALLEQLGRAMQFQVVHLCEKLDRLADERLHTKTASEKTTLHDGCRVVQFGQTLGE
jgi:hypothetical protein